MSFGPARTAIKAYIIAGFSSAPISWENEQFVLPSHPTAFVRIEISGVSNLVTTTGEPGNNMFTHTGVIFAYCFTLVGIGASAGDTIADAISVLLQRKEIPAPTVPQCVRTRDPEVRGSASDEEDGNYYRTDVVVPFDFYYFG
jgi:hypothetical protein